MSKQAITKVYIGLPGRVELELTNYIESFSYEEAVDKDNQLDVRLKSDYALELLESPIIKTGKPICFQFGYINEPLSELHTLTITDINADYTSKVLLTLMASDQAISIKKSKGKEVYNGMTASDIAKKVAKKYNLKAVVTPTTRVYNSLAQGKKNDFQVLKMLAADEPGFISYVTNSTVFFVKRNLDSKSTLLVNMGEQGVISFSPKWQEMAADGDANSTSAVGVDPANKSIIDVLAGNDSADDTNLGTENMEILNGAVDRTGYVLGNFESDKKGGAGGTVSGVTSVEEGKAKATAKQNEAKIKVLVGSLKMLGDPLIKVDTVITIGRVARVHQGNWYISSIRHDITGSSYVNTIELGKNAVSRKDFGKDVVNGKVNTTIGNDNITSSKELEFIEVIDGDIKKVRNGTREITK